MSDRRLREYVAEEIRSLLARRKMSAAELGRRAGIKQAYLSRRMTGEVAFNLDDLETIAAVLQVDPEGLLPPSQADERDRMIITIDRATARQVLDLPMQQPNDADAATVRDYLVKLLATLWEEGEGFSGKRPFGNSGWDYDLFPPLIRAGLVRGEFDEDGYIEDLDDRTANQLVAAAIRELGRP